MKHKATANEEYVWQVKNKKQEQVSGSDPVKAMTEFGQKYGTRGEIRITRWQRTNGDMLTSTGVNFKGTFKEVVEKLKHYVSTAVANGGAFKTNWSPMETKLVSILKELDPLHGIEVKELREKLAGKAWEDLKKIPKPVDQAIENLISAGYMHKIRRGKQWWVKPDKIVTEATADFAEAKPDGEAPKSSGSSLLGNAVIGDVKRIQSLIKTWSSKKGKGAPDPEQLKEYIAYQKDVAGYILKTYLPKVPDNYKAKIKAI